MAHPGAIPRLDHDWSIGYLSGVGMLTDGRVPRHTHWPDAMRRMLAEERPDLVLADHGFAGAAIEVGIETLSVADVNDPALLVAKAQGRTEVVVVMDDHVAADYWPCFQAAAARVPPGQPRRKGGLSGGVTLPLQSAHREEGTLHRGSAVDRERGR